MTRSFAIVTTNANAMTAELHDRIPGVLEQQIWSGRLRHHGRMSTEVAFFPPSRPISIGNMI